MATAAPPPAMMLSEEVERKISVCVRRFMFRHRNQGPDETVLEYAVELRRLAKGCKFSEVCVRECDEMSEMKFPTTYYSESIRRHLFGRTLLTFESALKVAVAKEAADLEVLEEEKALTKSALGAVKKTPGPSAAGKGNGASKSSAREHGKHRQRHNCSQRPMYDDHEPRECQ